MSKRNKKAIKKAYRRGRKAGYDHGFRLARWIYAEIAASYKAEIERLNTEIIMGKEEDADEHNE